MMKALLPFLLIAVSSFALADSVKIDEESKEVANSIYQDVKNSSMGNAQGLKDQGSALLSDSNLSTLDGNTEIDFTLQCQSNNTFLEVMAQPLSNGNAIIHHVKQDTTMDGEIDSILTLNATASGICSNGFLYCSDPKNNTGCTSYKWKTTTSGKVTTEIVPITELGGCYCINSSCGSSTWNNLSIILNNLATGAAATLTEYNPFYAITKIEQQDTSALVKGVNTGSCSDSTEAEDIHNKNYINNPGQLTTDGYASAENDEMFNLIANSDSNLNYDTQQCQIKRYINVDEATIEDIVTFDAGSSSDGGAYISDAETVTLVLGKIGDDYLSGRCFYYVNDTYFYIRRPELIKSATLIRANFDDWVQLHINGNHVWNGPYGTWAGYDENVPGKCELGRTWDFYPNVSFKNLLTTEGRYNFRVRTEVDGEGESYMYAEIKAAPYCAVTADGYTNSCEALQKDPDCTLLEEKVDGVTTFTNGYSTGLFPITSSSSDLYCGKTVARDWWIKKRTYQCQSEPANWEDAFIRAENVQNTLDEEGTFTDIQKQGDEWQQSSGNVTTFEFEGGYCAPSCKTRKQVNKQEITLSSIAETAYEYFYYECDSSNVCPSGDDEEVITACSCINEFNEAATALQSLRLANEDMICSSGSEGTPQ